MHDVTDTVARSYAAIPAAVGRVRGDIAAFALECGVDETRVDDIKLAVSEAVTNAIVHGYRETSGTVRVTAEHVDGALSVSVQDFGCGMQPRPIHTVRSGMGLGLALIGRVVSEMSVHGLAGGGTEVRMRFDLVPTAEAAPDRSRQLVGELPGV